MKIVTSDMVNKMDNYCKEVLKIPGIILMENAAIKVLKNINTEEYSNFTIVCGKGNNGGDAFAIARHLITMSKRVEVFLIGSEENMAEDCRQNYVILKNMGVKINHINNYEDAAELRESVLRCDLVIDGLFGTGLSRKLEGIYDLVVSIINENSKLTISIDVPSGMNGNTGEILGNCVRAKKTITFQCYKKGFIAYGTDKFTGEIIVEEIGIPYEVVNKFHGKEYVMDREMIRETFKVRNKYSHKGDYGRILLAAGSKGFTGASYLTAEAAVMSGAGLVTLCCPEEIRNILSIKLSEAMTISIDEKEKLCEVLDKADAVGFGPGLGLNKTLQLLKFFLENGKCPIVIDADGINVLKDNLSIIRNLKVPIILTPHIGEMCRITGLDTEYVIQNRIKVAFDFAKENGVIILLKGYNTVITDGSRVFINPTGNSSMASGGMGDTLTGIITSLIGQGYSSLEASCLGAYIHGYCGDILSKKMFCVNATELLNELPYAIRELQK